MESSPDASAILESLGAARRFADPAAAREARLMAASGALPLPPPQLAAVLFALTLDSDADVQQRASRSLEGLPAPIVGAVLEAPVHPALLAWFAERARDDEGRLEKIALNPASSDDTLCFVASRPFLRVIDIVSTNHTRLLRCPGLIGALGENPLTGQAVIDRLMHFLQIEQGLLQTPETQDEISEVAELIRQQEVPAELLDDKPGAEDGEADGEDTTKSLWVLLQDMNAMQKIKLALFGNGEARGLLIRDRNRVVASAVLRSPKLTQKEVASFAKSRTVCDEVIRSIASSREWTRLYPVQLGLVTNPKTAIPTAIKFLNYLTDRDLKQIMRSRDVPGPVSVQARRILSRKGKI